jgi:hypothetical protein
MGVYESRGQLGEAMKDLYRRWAETKMAWYDAQAEEFETTVLFPLEADLKTAAGAMDHMSVLLAQARRDCQ